MSNDPGIGGKGIATVAGVKGECSAGHKARDTIELQYPDSYNFVTLKLQRFDR